MAKKYQTQNSVKGPSELIAGSIRLPLPHAGNIPVPPRAKKVHVPRRRLEIVSFPEAAHSVKIIHSVPKMDRPLPIVQKTQSQCV